MTPRYTLRQLAYFVGAAESGTVAGAAKDFFMTQSAMSAALTDLEAALGAQLLVRRRGRGLELTPSGHVFLSEARLLLRDAENLGELAGSLHDSLSGTLSVGCFNAMSPAVLTPLIVQMAAAHPGVQLDIHSDSQDTLTAGLLSGQLELALMYAFDLPTGLDVHKVVESVGHALLPAGHRLASREVVSVEELRDTPLIAVTTSPARALTQIFRLSGIELIPALELENFDLIRSLVHAGRGYTIFSQPLGGTPPHWSSGVVAIPIEERLPPLTVVAAHNRGIRLTRRAEAFLELCTSRGPELLSYPIR